MFRPKMNLINAMNFLLMFKSNNQIEKLGKEELLPVNFKKVKLKHGNSLDTFIFWMIVRNALLKFLNNENRNLIKIVYMSF